MRIPFACVLLLSATALAQPNDSYRKFINQHINGRMSADRCDQVIGERNIKINVNDCKEKNTFILATTNHVRAICGQAGEPFGQMTKSLQPFQIIVCQLRNQGARPPRCQYRGQARTRKIAIRCANGFPVHFEGDIVHFEN
ncbi:angiogenin-like [Cebidichthys violaceus]|uniref:angiogenin-like n=1 Tax=Cebidichthys violaceus TaxID=271503 RepID=UPI0035C9F18B